MKKGDIVTIWRDAFSDKPRDQEGKAELLQRFEGPKIMQGRWAEFWEVKFVGEEYICGRWVVVEKKK